MAPRVTLLARLRTSLATLACACALAACASTPAVRLADLTALQQQADGAYAHHDWRAAAEGYRVLTERVPDDTAYWFRLGNSYARMDEPESAVRAYRAALQRNPHLAPAWHNLGAVLLEQAQAALQQAAAMAAPGDPLQADSARLAAHIAAVRRGTPADDPARATSSAGAAPATASASTSTRDAQGGQP